ncbi:sodium:calcium antiporter, partial [Faecalibacterium prausnitzii]|nr:sodium:calcium antiporter [Faecalibacterium prausnitzii]
NLLLMKKAPAAAEAEAEAENAGEEMSLTNTLVLLVLGAVLIALGATLLVDNGTLIAQALRVPESVIALTFVPQGTSL